MSRSRRRLNARRRLASVGCLPSVRMGSTTRRSSFALGSVVCIASCRRSDTVMLRSIASRWLLVRFSFLSPWRWRIFFSRSPLAWNRSVAARGLEPDRRPVLELHAEGEPARREHFLDLVQRLAAEVRRLEELRLGALDEVADVVDVLRLETVGRAHGELQVVDRAQQRRVDLGRLLLLDVGRQALQVR